MKQYKTIAGPTGINIGSDGSYDDAVAQYAAIINGETAGGWELDCIQPICVTKAAPPLPEQGCLAGLFVSLGLKQAPVQLPAETVTFNMLIFVKNS